MSADDEAKGRIDPVRICPACGSPMTFLGLVKRVGQPATRVDRCYACNHVTTEQV